MGVMDAPAMKFATTRDGLKIAYYSVGAGRPLVRLGPIPFRNIRLEWERLSRTELWRRFYLPRTEGT